MRINYVERGKISDVKKKKRGGDGGWKEVDMNRTFYICISVYLSFFILCLISFIYIYIYIYIIFIYIYIYIFNNSVIKIVDDTILNNKALKKRMVKHSRRGW